MLGATKRAVKSALRIPADALLASASNFPSVMNGAIYGSPEFAKILGYFLENHPNISSKFISVNTTGEAFTLAGVAEECAVDPDLGLPIPPRNFWQGYAADVDEYLASGKENVETMMKILEGSGYTAKGGDRLLDLGCAGGRMVRWLKPMTAQCEVWGADIDARNIEWCRSYLSPPFFFTTVTTLPHLPFEDNSFNLIYCGSVFTHIPDLVDSWLLELRRILRPGGRLYLTVHDENTVKHLTSDDSSTELARLIQPHFTKDVFDGKYRWFKLNRGPQGTLIFYKTDYLREQWGNYFASLSLHPNAYGYQTAVVLEK